jgi:ketosteroid isomerase-like protein
VTDAADRVGVVEAFLHAFNDGDLAALRACLADDVVASITGADGGPVELVGADDYVAAVGAMNLPAVDYSVTMTQRPVPVPPDRVLVMVEVRRAARELLCTTSPGTCSEWPAAGLPGCGWWTPSRPRATRSGAERPVVR